VWRSIDHGKPVVNGYSGYDPPHHRLLRLALERRDPAVLGGVAEYGPILVAIDNDSGEAGFWRHALAETGATETTGGDKRRTYVMLPRREAPGRPSGVPLRIIAGSASPGAFALRDVTDGNPATYWVSSELQRADEQMLVQLDGVHRVSGVILSTGLSAEAYPRLLRIETSQDGATWTAAAEEAPAGLAFSAILRDFARSELSFRLPDVESRYVRLRQLGRDPRSFWVVRDITILGQ
jgi:hypothetical protein